MRKVLGIFAAVALAVSMLGSTALAVSPNSGNPYDGSDGYGLLENGMVTLCHYTGHSREISSGTEYDWVVKSSLGVPWCETPPGDIEPGMIILVSPNALDGHKCVFESGQLCSEWVDEDS